MRMLVVVACLVVAVVGAALVLRADGDGASHRGTNERVEPVGGGQAAREPRAPTRARDAGEPRRETSGQEPRPARRPAGSERRPGELRLPDRAECRVPDAFDVPGCSGGP